MKTIVPWPARECRVALAESGGPGGTFSNGLTAFQGVTNSSGQVAANFTPNAIAGTFQINLTASVSRPDRHSCIFPDEHRGRRGFRSSFGDSRCPAAPEPKWGRPSEPGEFGWYLWHNCRHHCRCRGSSQQSRSARQSRKVRDEADPPARRTVRIGQVGAPTVDPPGGWQKSKLRPERPEWRP